MGSAADTLIIKWPLAYCSCKHHLAKVKDTELNSTMDIDTDIQHHVESKTKKILGII